MRSFIEKEDDRISYMPKETGLCREIIDLDKSRRKTINRILSNNEFEDNCLKGDLHEQFLSHPKGKLIDDWFLKHEWEEIDRIDDSILTYKKGNYVVQIYSFDMFKFNDETYSFKGFALRYQKQLDDEKRFAKMTVDIAKYQEIAITHYAQEIKESAWDELIATYPEAKKVVRHDIERLSSIFNEDYIYTDPETGIMWPLNGNIAGRKMSLYEAMEWVQTFDYAGYSDWFIPDFTILKSLKMRAGGENPSKWFNDNRFHNVQEGYWSTSLYPSGSNEGDPVGLWMLCNSMCFGLFGNVFCDSPHEPSSIWPVRYR